MDSVSELGTNMKKSLVTTLLRCAESLKTLILSETDADINDSELSYFVLFIVSDTLKLSLLTDKSYREIEGDFRQQFIFDEFILSHSNSSEDITAFLNKHSIISSDRMNEYKEVFSVSQLSEGTPSIEQMVGLGKLCSKYICNKPSESYSFADTTTIVTMSFIGEQQRVQNDEVSGFLKNALEQYVDSPQPQSVNNKIIGLNKAILIGRLREEPRTRKSPTTTFCVLSLVTIYNFKDITGNVKEMEQLHHVIASGSIAEYALKNFYKGAMVFAEGRLRTRKWEDSRGIARFVTEIIASKVELLDSPKEEPKMYDMEPL